MRNARKNTRRLRLAAKSIFLVVLVMAVMATSNSPASAVDELEQPAAFSGGRGHVFIYGKGGNCAYAESAQEDAAIKMGTCRDFNIGQWEIVSPGAGGVPVEFLRLRLKGSAAVGGDPTEGLCLGVKGGDQENGTDATLLPCSEPSSMVGWQKPPDSSLVTLRRFVGDRELCLDVEGGQQAPGTSLQIWECADVDAQDFFIFDDRPQPVEVVGHGENCLTTSSLSPQDGDRIFMRDCGSSGNQHWILHDGYMIVNHKCLDVVNGATGWGATLQMFRCDDVPQQRWWPRSNGRIEGQQRDQCLDVAFQGTANGTEVWSYRCNETYAQGWYVGELPQRWPDTEALATQYNGAFKARLSDCRGMVHLRVGQVDLVAMRDPAPFVVRRTGDSFSSDARAAASGWTNRAAMNGAWFELPGGRFPLVHQGDIYRNGQRIARNPYPDYQGFHLTADNINDCGEWSIDEGAPSPAPFAIGGARPLIIDGARWGRSDEGLPNFFGEGLTFEDYDHWIFGKPTVGVRNDGIVLVIAQGNWCASLPHMPPECRRLTEIRDVYGRLGFQDAVLFDPNSSAALAVNGAMEISPGGGKDELIPYGWAMASRR